MAFMAINASIRYQFEFLQTEWVNNGEFAGLSKHDVDPFAGEPREGSRFRIVDPQGGSEEHLRPAPVRHAARRRLLLHPEHYSLAVHRRLKSCLSFRREEMPMTTTGDGTNPGGHDVVRAASATGADASPAGPSLSFLSDVAAAEGKTPLPAPPPALPDASDPRYASAPAAYETERQAAVTAGAAFAAAAKARGAAVGAGGRDVAGDLARSRCCRSSSISPRRTMPIFKPASGRPS